ncbi:MAG: DUF4058 family protein, partial [Rivularia sp. (in: cyanobacteria)]
MSNPFPGMNPYLENPELWPEVHSWIIIAIAESLVSQLRPKYRVAVEKRVYQMTDENTILVGIPDVSVSSSSTKVPENSSNIAVASPPAKPVNVTLSMPEEVREGYLEVREVGTGEVVTIIEVLSPKNKRAGEGRNAYQKKRQKILTSLSHLVEIDLLRSGNPMPILENKQFKSTYSILVSRSEYRPQAELYPFELQEAIPEFPLPLRQGDRETIVNLQELINGVYERAGFDMAIDYTCEPVPPLTEP